MPIDSAAVVWDDDATASGPIRVEEVQWDDAPVTDLPAVTSRPDFQDQSFTFPENPATGDILEYVRTMRPEMRGVSDAQLAAAVRRQGYPDMDPMEFYRSTGLDKKLGIDTSKPNPTEGMSNLDLFAAGAGSALDAAGRGIKQFATGAIGELAGDRTGLTSGQNAVTEWSADKGAQQLAENTEARRLNEPLLDTKAGLAGNITGNVGMIVAPGGAASMAARVPQLAAAAPGLTAFGSSMLPTTIRGSALAGGAMGVTAPVAEGESRALNTGLGFAAGGAGAAAPRVASAVAGRVARLSPAFTANAQQRAAGEVLEQFAQDPAAVRQSLASSQVIVPGSLPTLAEATEDAGLAGLQRTMANMPTMSAEMARRGVTNNQARVGAIQQAFGGANDGAAEAVRVARDVQARQTLRPIGNVPLQDMAPVTRGLERMIDRAAAAPNVRQALQAVQDEIPNIRTVQDAHNVRQYINQLMAGQVEGRAGGRLAQNQLMTVRGLLDRQMRQSFPEWGRFLREYQASSRELGQIETGANLLSRSGAIRDQLGNDVLSPAKFGNAADELDRTVGQATGFRRATANNVLTPEQIQTVDQVRRDLERYARTSVAGKAVGSNTMQNAVGGNALQDAVGPVGAAIVEPISGVALLGLNSLRRNYGQRVAAIVEEALLDPNRAAEILATLPSENRRRIVQTVGYLLNQSGSVGGRVPATE